MKNENNFNCFLSIPETIISIVISFEIDINTHLVDDFVVWNEQVAEAVIRNNILITFSCACTICFKKRWYSNYCNIYLFCHLFFELLWPKYLYSFCTTSKDNQLHPSKIIAWPYRLQESIGVCGCTTRCAARWYPFTSRRTPHQDICPTNALKTTQSTLVWLGINRRRDGTRPHKHCRVLLMWYWRYVSRQCVYGGV